MKESGRPKASARAWILLVRPPRERPIASVASPFYPHRQSGDTDAFRALLAERRIEAVIPSSARRKRPCPLNREAYRRRNLIERMFCRLKDWRRIATRYDRLAENFVAALALVATICFWIP